MEGKCREIIVLIHFSPNPAIFYHAMTFFAQQQTQIYTLQNHIHTDVEVAKELLVREVPCVPVLETSKAVQSALYFQSFGTSHN